ncbi:MAG: hypothetical protein ACKO3G_10520 [Planctomycetaceae bacterium]
MPRRRRVRRSLAALVLAAAASFAPPMTTARTDEPPEPPESSEPSEAAVERTGMRPLGDRLAIELRTRRPEDVAFLGQVERLVRDGRLPAKVVTSTAAWATRRGKARPFPSFRRALEIQADRLGVSLDEEP